MKQIEVAAAVIERPDGSFLLGQRAPDTFYPGYWEFPGGKVEAGETAREALIRELNEELGIVVERADPWLRREHRYEHANVRLSFFRVRRWQGEVHNHVHSALAWQRIDEATVGPMLPANGPVFSALALAEVYAITHAWEIGIDAQLLALAHALEGGLRLVQLCEAPLDAGRRAAFAHAAVDLCHQFQARVLVHGDVGLATRSGADGVHLTAMQLASCGARPEFPLVASSCPDAEALAQAARLGCDFALIGEDSLDRAGIDWGLVAAQLAVPPLPTFAPGGLSVADLDVARAAGAHGIASTQAIWRPA